MVERRIGGKLTPWSDRWDEYFLREARLIAEMSKDPSTQCGAVIVRPDKFIVSKGLNGFPQRIEDKPELYFNREEKYKRVIHCEMNAILTAGCDLSGCWLFTWPFPTCSRCAVHVIQTGIAGLVAPDVAPDLRERWGADIDLSMSLYREAGVGVQLTPPVPEEERKSKSILLSES